MGKFVGTHREPFLSLQPFKITPLNIRVHPCFLELSKQTSHIIEYRIKSLIFAKDDFPLEQSSLKNTPKSMDNEREGNHYLQPLDAIIFTQDSM